MISVSSFYTVEKDARYLIGKEQGLEQHQKQIAIRMKNLGYEPESIAKVLNLSIEEVKELSN